MWDLPGPGLEPMSPALAGGFLTTVPPGKPKNSLKKKKKSMGQQGCASSEGSREGSAPCSQLAVVLAFLSIHWLVDTSLQSLPPSSLGLLPMPPLFLQISLSLWGHQSLDLGPILIQYDLILTWLHLQRSNFQIRWHSQVLGSITLTYLLGDRIQSTHGVTDI